MASAITTSASSWGGGSVSIAPTRKRPA